MSSEAWIDVSVPVSNGMVHWPGDPPVEIERSKSIDAGDPANLTKLSMSAHTGTHMDAPVHFVPDTAGIDALPLEAVIGRCRVIAIEDPDAVHAAELRAHAPKRGERLLLRTHNSSEGGWSLAEFDDGFVHIAPEGAGYLAECGVRTVGVDYLSVGGMETGAETHGALLEAGIWIIEGLDLSAVEPGEYELMCLPVKLAGSDGAPARALLRPPALRVPDEA